MKFKPFYQLCEFTCIIITAVYVCLNAKLKGPTITIQQHIGSLLMLVISAMSHCRLHSLYFIKMTIYKVDKISI